MIPSTENDELSAVVEALEALSEFARDPEAPTEVTRYEIETADGEVLAELRALSSSFEDDDPDVDPDVDVEALVGEADDVRLSYDLLRSLGD